MVNSNKISKMIPKTRKINFAFSRKQLWFSLPENRMCHDRIAGSLPSHVIIVIMKIYKTEKIRVVMSRGHERGMESLVIMYKNTLSKSIIT